MKKFFLVFVTVFAVVIGTVYAQQEDGEGIAVNCDNGAEFTNGIEVTVVQMRSGFNYTATAIGLNGFDPVLAVLNEDGDGLCSDDERDADYYEAELPTTGFVESSNRTAQVVFSQNSRSAFADVSLVVGGVDDEVGEVVLILEGMAATDADGAGDVFAVRLTEDMVNSEIPLSVYMVSVSSRFDPLLGLIDSDYNYLEDGDGNTVYCDDAGNEETCWGEHESLEDSGLSRTEERALPGGELDAMLSIPLSNVDFDQGDQWYNFVATSYRQETFGDYMMAFHFSVGDASQREDEDED